MRAKGITYDTGWVHRGALSRARFEPPQLERELRMGLEIWFSPYPLELTAEEMLALFGDCADRAERLRRRGGEVVFVTGAEVSLMNPGFLPGGSTEERLALLSRPDRVREVIADVGPRVNDGFYHRPDGDPRDDLDLASYGIVAVYEDRLGETYPDMPWEPKTAFTTVAEYHRAH